MVDSSSLIFMIVKEVVGETLHKPMSTKYATQLTDFSYSITNEADISSNSGGTTLKRGTLEPISVNFKLDSSVFQFMHLLAIGKYIEHIEIYSLRPSDNTSKVRKSLHYRFNTALITSLNFSTSDDMGGDASMSFIYGAIRSDFIPIDKKGNDKAPIRFQYDVQKNKESFPDKGSPAFGA